MKAEHFITFEGSYVQVLSDGDKNFDFSTSLWTETVELCNKHQCFDVLGIANSTRPLETMDGFNHAELFRKLGITRKFRIAWVEQNPKGFEAVQFVETVLYNRGFNVCLFPNVQEARKWLSSVRAPQNSD